MTITKELLDKSRNIHTISVDTGKVSKKSGKAIKFTVYFNKGEQQKDGSWKPNSESYMVTPVEAYAQKVKGCHFEKCHTAKFYKWVDGVKKLDKQYRWFDSDLTDADRAEISLHNGDTYANEIGYMIQKLQKKLASQTARKLEKAKRAALVQLFDTLLPERDRLLEIETVTEKAGLITLF